MSSLEILCSMSGGKCRMEKNYQKNKIFDENVYLLELIVFDDSVTKISLKPANNSPTSKQTRLKQFSVRDKKNSKNA